MMSFRSPVLPSISRLRLRLLAGLAAGLLAACAQAITTDFSAGWRFHLGDAPGAEAPAFADSSWEKVAVPHPARLEALVTDKDAHQQWEGLCWYRKTFTLPRRSAGQVVQLRFEGAMNLAEVFVNGQKRAQSLDGYTPFVVDLSDLARDHVLEPVTIALRLDNHASDLTGPKPLESLDFHLYHGLYRTVSLSIQPPLHLTDEIADNRPAAGGVFVTYPEISETSATIATQASVRNAATKPARFSVTATLRDLSGRELAHVDSPAAELPPGQTRDVSTRLTLASPKLWSPAEPNLYLLDVAVVSRGQVVDTKRERIGLRRAALQPGGLVLNGKKIFLRGVNRHQEHPYVGNALSANAQYRDAYRIKQAGFDYIRLSHYPQDPAFMAACDELGLVTMDAILGWQYNPGTPEFMANRLAASRALVRRDRNHPSTLFWELSLNETSMTPEFIAALHAAGHEEFPGDQMFTAGWMTGFDLKGTARQHGSTKEFADATFPAFVSEYGDWEYYAQNAGLNQEAWQNLQQVERTSRQLRGDGEVRLLQQATNLQEAHNDNRSTQALADGYWVMFDYNRGYAPDLESSGIMDIFRLPKFSYYFFQSQRDATEVRPGVFGGPMIFIASYWTAQSPTDVRIFSNGEEVELWLNGRSLGRQKPDQNRLTTHLAHPPFTFHVGKFEPGELHAAAYLAGKTVAEQVVRTPRAPHHLALDVDLSGRPLGRDGDLVFLHARVVDAAGTVVPDAALPVKFTVDGDAQLIGDNPIAAEAGIASILLKTGTHAGQIRLHATAGALTGDIVVKAVTDGGR